MMLSICASSFVHYGVRLGLGRHTAAVVAEYGQEHLSVTAKYQMLGYPFNIGVFSFPNIAISILVCQLLDPNPFRTRLLYGMAVLQVVFAMITVILAFSQCTPTRKLWEKTTPGTCWSPNVLNYFSYWLCAYTTLTDFVLAVVPAAAFWKLQMKRSTKIGLCILMSMTMLSAIVTIIKGSYLHLFTDTADPLYNPVPLVLWGLVEQNIVIMAACVPTMRPLFHRTWDPSKAGAQSQGGRASALSCKDTSHQLTEMDPKEYAESTESQQGIMRTMEISVQRGSADERPSNCIRDVIPQSLRESQQ
ncbi:hypothetical protein E8E13_011607 [Curvularia kusanoi]|uniref:Rhodopsin domain-containing protein n=1 Tax=Curvularia kusanoi TaxID=90978 RepID=A0A9P4TPK9_CURKU|nr:hypothetical protein E8E13_011607 [Curvularia kusanoi]